MAGRVGENDGNGDEEVSAGETDRRRVGRGVGMTKKTDYEIACLEFDTSIDKPITKKRQFTPYHKRPDRITCPISHSKETLQRKDIPPPTWCRTTPRSKAMITITISSL